MGKCHKGMEEPLDAGSLLALGPGKFVAVDGVVDGVSVTAGGGCGHSSRAR